MNRRKYAPKPNEGKQEGKGRILFAFLTSWMVWGLASGCGYTLSHRLKKNFLSDRGVFVPVMYNQTEEVGAERVFTDALVRQLQSWGEVVLSSREKGALELRGTLKNLDYAPSAYTAPGFGGMESYRRAPSQIGVSATLLLELIDPNTGKTLWADTFSDFRRVDTPTVRTFDYQSPSSVPLYTQSLIESTYQDLADDIMRDVYDDMVEVF